MARQEIDLTTPQPNGKMGEPTKAAWEKVNDMTAEIYASPAMNGSLQGRNMLINCGIPINQRGFVGGALAVNVYGYDRWKGGSGGCNITINPSTGEFNQASGALQQMVESPLDAWGRPLTFSVDNPSSQLTVSIGGAVGTIQPGQGRRSVTVTPTGSGNMSVLIGATGATYSRPQLERGTVASSFEYRPEAIEWILCQRYFEAVGFIAVANGPDFTSVFYKTRKRTTPSIYLITGSISPATLNPRGNSGYFSMDGRASSAAPVIAAVDAEI